jgi:uncharacterized membrane-anchored protein
MKVRHLSAFTGLKRAAAFGLIGVVTGVFCLHSECQAQQTYSQSAIFSDPLKQVTWISGPQKITIGDFADVNIPAGYRFTDARGARVILGNANSPVPDDLIGVLAKDSDAWLAVMEYSPKGYVKNVTLAQINSTTILKGVQKQLQTPDNGITSVNWVSQPAYDSEAHLLTWSLQVQSASGKFQNEAVAMLGRHGVMEITGNLPYPLAADAPSLKQVASNISFKEGERYSDYQSGDKVAEIGLVGLIAGEDGEHAFAAGTATWVYWVYSGLAVCIVLGGVMVLVMRKKGRHHHRHHHHHAHAPVPASAPAQTIAAQQPSPVLSNGVTNGHAPANGVSTTNGVRHHRNRSKKRVFDYPKFYTNVMKELSFHSYGASPMMLNGKSNGNGYRNGHTNGHANGHTNGHSNGSNGSNGHANGTNGSGVNEAIKSGIEELIATQKNLIQEQKCLLEQQTRLIEEKRWLIEEQTAFLKGQASMMDEQQYPLKFEQ